MMRSLVALLALCAVAYGFTPRLDGRIVGGVEVDIVNFPYQVSVRIYDQHICGGSIIDANTVLTAAHCVYGMDHSQYSVRVGNSRHVNGVSHRVSSVRQHESYNPTVIDNDMAILKLSSPITFTDRAQPVELQPRDVEIDVGTNSWVSGWGLTTENGVSPDVLRAVDVAVISNFDCARKYGNQAIISEHMLCAQTIYHDACQGDSGGPLVANGKLVGVVSWGFGCARPQYPGVYAKVSNMHDWVQTNRY